MFEKHPLLSRILVTFGIAFALVGVFLIIYYNNPTKKTNTAEENRTESYRSTLREALKNLENTNQYIVTNALTAPDGNLFYLTVKANGNFYTDYPIDDDGNYGTIAFDEVAENQKYLLTDYWVDNKNYYAITSDDEGNTFTYKFPETFAEANKNKSNMYFAEMVDKFTAIDYVQDVQMDIGNGTEDFTLYKCTLPNDVVAEIMGKENLVKFECLNNATEDTNIKNLCDYYINEYKNCLVFSDAEVYVGVDKYGTLKYVDLKTGGLGTYLYLSMAVNTSNFTPRMQPDTETSGDYLEVLKMTADEVAKYSSVEEGLQAMLSEGSY